MKNISLSSGLNASPVLDIQSIIDSYMSFCFISLLFHCTTYDPCIWSDARAAWNFRISRAMWVNKTEDLFLRDGYLIPCKPYSKGLPFHIIMRCHITVGYHVPIGYHINMRSHVGVCCPCSILPSYTDVKTFNYCWNIVTSDTFQRATPSNGPP